jgi:hypothetical protein
MVIWNPNSFTSIGDGDLSILTLVPATASPVSPVGKPIQVNVAVLAARRPSVEESISLIGFAASETEFEKLTDDRGAGVSCFGSVGPVIDVYPEGRDRSLPNPSAGVAAKTVGGMSGGGAFDAQGRLIGIITSGVGEEEVSFITLSWPSVFTPIEISWPPGLTQGPTTLHAMTQRRLCRIEGIDALSSHVNEAGEPMVGLSSPPC